MSARKVIKETVVPKEYKYAIDRGVYLLNRTHSNLAFMLGKHLDDEDPEEFVNSEIFDRLLEQCIDARIEAWTLFIGVYQTLGIKDIDRAQFRWERENDYYVITEWKR